MVYLPKRLFVTAVLLLVYVVLLLEAHNDYYQTLGVRRSASTKEIRSSFRKLARIWHPDKNRSPSASDKFVQINEAYKVLSDPKTRTQYDRGAGHPSGYQFDPFNIVITPFARPAPPRQDSIEADVFFTTVLPQSNVQPYLLYVYSHHCMFCGAADKVWNNFKQQGLSNSGVAMATVHLHTTDISNYLGVLSVPSIVLLLEEEPVNYRDVLNPSIGNVKQFILHNVPTEFIAELSTDNFQSFINSSIQDNKPKFVIISPKLKPSLEHHLAALRNCRFISFGFITTAGRRNSDLVKELNAVGKKEAVFLFKEDFRKPFAKRWDLSSKELFKFCESHNLLELPRLSSKEHYRKMCQNERGCVLLLVPESSEDFFSSSYLKSWRKTFMGQFGPAKGYVDSKSQKMLLDSFGLLPLTLERCSDDVSHSWKLLHIRHGGKNGRAQFGLSEFCPDLIYSDSAVLLPAKWKNAADPIDFVNDEDDGGLFKRLWMETRKFFRQFVNTLQLYPQLLALVIAMVMMFLWMCFLPTEPMQNMNRTGPREQDFLNFEDDDDDINDWRSQAQQDSSGFHGNHNDSSAVNRRNESHQEMRLRQGRQRHSSREERPEHSESD